MGVKILLLLFNNICIHLAGSPLVFSFKNNSLTLHFSLLYITTATL